MRQSPRFSYPTNSEARWMLLPTTRRHAVVFLLLLAGIYFVSTTTAWTTVQSTLYGGYGDLGMLLNDTARPGSIREQMASIRPIDSMVHSRTLGIADGIYVVALKRATERVRNMTALATALDLDFTFVDATDAHDPQNVLAIDRIMDRVQWQRGRIDDREADEEEIPIPDNRGKKDFVFNAFPFAWSADAEAPYPSDEPLGIYGSDYWGMQPLDSEWETAHPIVTPKATDEKVVITWEGRPRIPNAVEENGVFLKGFLTRASIGCIHSHAKVLRDIVERGLKSAIIFEDDVDIEWDIERMLRSQWDALPKTWDIVYLGHCWSSQDIRQPSLPHAPSLHKTSHALCTHGYAVSLKGATLISRYLRSPDYAFSRPLDQMLKDLIQMKRLESYTVVPPVVVQTKSTVSEVSPGGFVNAEWEETSGEHLLDSTLERVGMWVKKMGRWPGE